jgi:hypothetical protein
MKALIIGASWIKEYESSFGIMHMHRIKYGEKEALYLSKKKEQTYFTPNKECEFTEEIIKGKDGKPDWVKVKPIRQGGGQSNFGRAVKKEQSKYSGFAMAYAKDLFVAGKVESIEQMYAEAQNMIDWMVAQDKALES